MTFLEKDLEDIIWESNNEKLQERGIGIYGKKIRQLRIGNYGISDIITIERSYQENFNFTKDIPYLDITIFELKKDKVSVSTFLQSVRYCKGIHHYLKIKKPNLNYKLNIVLCGKEIDKNSDFVYLADLFPDSMEYGFSKICSLKLYEYDFSLEGLVFKDISDYFLKDNGFKL
jgi:hypothetical protein